MKKYYDSDVSAEIHEITRYFDKIIRRQKTPAKRNQSREMKILALEGLQMCCSAFIDEAINEERLTNSQMEVQL